MRAKRSCETCGNFDPQRPGCKLSSGDLCERNDFAEWEPKLGEGVRDPDFRYHWNKIAEDVLACAKAHGWHSDQHEGISISLMHSELSEALEAYRHGNPTSDHIPPFTAVEEEMADIVIRVMDHCAARGHRVSDAILAKIKYNNGRPHKHGGKAY